MKEIELLQGNLLVSKSLIQNLKETPEIPEIEVEFTPENKKNRVEAFISDAVHEAIMTKGKRPKATVKGVGQKMKTKITVKGNLKSSLQIANWVKSRKIGEPFTRFQNVDNKNGEVNWSSHRTYILYEIENDIKFQLGINEIFMGQVKAKVKLRWNEESDKNRRAREMFARRNGRPLRIVKKNLKSA